MSKYQKVEVALFLCLLPFMLAAQGGFQKTYGSLLGDDGRKIIFTNDSCFVFTGSLGGKSFMAKADTAGNTVWQKSFGLRGHSVRQTPDNGFIVVGYKSVSSGNTDLHLIKTNSSGDTLWSKAYRGPSPGSNYTIGYDIIVTSDSGYAVIGKEDGQDDNMFMIRTDNNGIVTWSKKFSGIFDDAGYAIKQTPDNGFIVAGYSHNTTTLRDVCLLKLTATGSIMWAKTYGNTRYDYANDVSVTTDGGFIVTGVTSGTGTGTIYDDDLFLLRTDSSGNINWSFTYGGDAHDAGTAVKQTADGGFIATGYMTSPVTEKKDAYLLKTDTAGNVEWSHIYGGSADDLGNDVIEFPGGFAIIGETRNFSKGLTDIYLLSVSSTGDGTCKQDSVITFKTLQPWTLNSGITSSDGFVPSTSQLSYGITDSIPSDPCICQPPVAYFTAGVTDICAWFNDYSTWADTWFWSFGTGDTSVAQEPMYCWPVNGTYNICLTVTNTCGTGTYCDSMFVSMGINEIAEKIKINIAPNPALGTTLLKFDNPRREKLTLLVVTPTGQQILQTEIRESVHNLSVNDLAAGIYYVLLEHNGRLVGTEKLMVAPRSRRSD